MTCHCGSTQFEEYSNTVGKFRKCLSCGFPTMIKSRSLYSGLIGELRAAMDELEVKC